MRSAVHDGIVIHPDDASNISVAHGSVLALTVAGTDSQIIGVADVREELGQGGIGVHESLRVPAGMEEDAPVQVSACARKEVCVDSIELTIERVENKIPGSDIIQAVRSREKNLLQFMKDRIFTGDSCFYWEEMGVNIGIRKTAPGLGPEAFGRFGNIHELKYSSAPDKGAGYEGLLLMDMSGSMGAEDLFIPGSEEGINLIENKYNNNKIKIVAEAVKAKTMAKRREGAVLAAMAYASGWHASNPGGSFGFVLFSDEAYPVEFAPSEQICHDNNVSMDDIAEATLGSINNNWHGHTNLSDALLMAIELSGNFDHRATKVFTILTDGKPDNKKLCAKLVRERLSPRMDVIINIMGLGGKVDDKFLRQVAMRTGGEFIKLGNLKEMIMLFGQCGEGYHVTASGKNLSECSVKAVDRAKQPRSRCCPVCDQPLSYYAKQRWWYCDKCRTYQEKDRPRHGCKTCRKPLSFIGRHQAWHCYKCGAK